MFKIGDRVIVLDGSFSKGIFMSTREIREMHPAYCSPVFKILALKCDLPGGHSILGSCPEMRNDCILIKESDGTVVFSKEEVLKLVAEDTKNNSQRKNIKPEQVRIKK